MTKFLHWLEHLVMLSAVVGVLAFFVAALTGGGLSEGEGDFFGKALAVWFGVIAVGYIISPEPPTKRRRRP